MPVMRGGFAKRNRARHLRKNPTEAEKRLWSTLRPLRKSYGLHFRRQMPLGDYIVDFSIASRKLVIEVDGGQHAEGADAERDAWIASQGWQTLRFWNTDVFGNLEGVTETIVRACGADPNAPLRGAPHPRPLPVNEEGGASGNAGAEPGGSPPPVRRSSKVHE